MGRAPRCLGHPEHACSPDRGPRSTLDPADSSVHSYSEALRQALPVVSYACAHPSMDAHFLRHHFTTSNPSSSSHPLWRPLIHLILFRSHVITACFRSPWFHNISCPAHRLTSSRAQPTNVCVSSVDPSPYCVLSEYESPGTFFCIGRNI